jgi:hypothetical protein
MHENLTSFGSAAPPEGSLRPAFYPNKEFWKCQPGNRYTPEELAQMDKNWQIAINNPDKPHSRVAD